jgi:alkanesulfonate monooxygenase SsuD/methylene tetrahydromethanopterin reductase-like flavin-dependent oxidoreductase (luciferase family)
MSDYGHELLFGTFLTPTNQQPDHVVALARLSEEVGLDLATFQDHPYQPRFLDTWTLLSYVAAQTSRIRLAANVTNLPLRPPAVLARSVASLDLLSGGRVELGLGAGAFWDAIEAMGGRRLTPGQGVEALGEAIEVIRQVWDADGPGGVRVDGQHYRVAGAKRGPAPAHDVGIWLGAYKPRMLALTGRSADGWLPSLGYVQPGDLSAGNAIIDDAAQQAGRSPQAVRRLLNITGEFTASGGALLHGPPGQWARELAALALDQGVSGFILGSDNADDIRRFAADVAPAVREIVDAERGSGTTPPTTDTGKHAVSSAASTQTRPSVSAGVARGPFAVVPTPDDGKRLTDVQVWDESTRPSGPAPDPARTYAAHDQANAQHLIDVHDALRSELDQVKDLIEQVAAGTLDVGSARSHINTMTIRQNRWTLGTYCESYCRIVTTHHTLEDQGMFPHLRRREPRLAPVVDRLQEEHLAIHDVLEGVDRALVALVSVSDGMTDLRAAVDLLSDALLSHLAYEERELVEPLTRLGLG